MTKLELEVLLKLIDSYAETYTPPFYGLPSEKRIKNVDELKKEIIKTFSKEKNKNV